MEVFLVSQLNGDELCVPVSEATTFEELRKEAADAFQVADPSHITLSYNGTECRLTDVVSQVEVGDGEKLMVEVTREYVLEKITSAGLELRACPEWATRDPAIATVAVLRHASAWHCVHSSLLESADFLGGVIADAVGGDSPSQEGFVHDSSSQMIMTALGEQEVTQGYHTTLLAIVFSNLSSQEEMASLYQQVARHVPKALLHMPGDLRGDKAFMLSLCCHDAAMECVVSCAMPALLEDDDFLLQVAGRGHLRTLPLKARQDRVIVKAALRANSSNVSYISYELELDWEIARIVAQSDSYDVTRAQRNLFRTSGDFALHCLEGAKSGEMGFMRFSVLHSYPMSFAKKACVVNGLSLRFFPRMQCEKAAVLTAVSQCGQALRYVNRTTTLCIDRDVLLAAVKQSSKALRYAHPAVRHRPGCLAVLLKENPDALRYVPISVLGSSAPALLSEAFASFGCSWKHASVGPLRACENFMLKSIDHNPRCIKHAAPSLRHSYTFVSSAAAHFPALCNLLLAGFEGRVCEVGERLPRAAFCEARRLRIPLKHVRKLAKQVLGGEGLLADIPYERRTRKDRLQKGWDPAKFFPKNFIPAAARRNNPF